MNDEKERYATMTELGKMHGVSSHVLGRWLTRCQLREGGEPTDKAKRGGYTKQVLEETRGVWFWVWHVARTKAALEALLEECMGRKVQVIDPDHNDNC